MNAAETPIRAFAIWLSADGFAETTAQAYVRDLTMLSKALSEENPDTVLLHATRSDLATGFASPKILILSNGKPRSPSSLKRMKCATRTFFSWATAARLIANNPAKSIKIKPSGRKLPIFLTLSEKKCLLKTLRTTTSKVSMRDRVMIEVLLRTGIRVSELVNLDLSHVDLDDKRFRIVAKGGNEQLKFIKSNLRLLLKKYIKHHRPSVEGEDALFLSNWKRRISVRQVEMRVKHWVAAAGIKKDISPHKLRHTFATHLLAEKGNLQLVKRALGHESITSTTIYTHVVDEDVAEAVEELI